MAVYPVTWSSDIKLDVFNKFLDSENQAGDKHI